jgi:3-deoxy-D-manno-octulosonic-acid transferase
MRRPATLFAYRCATWGLSPLAPALLAWRAARGKEMPARKRERLGYADRPRPRGALVWLHGASVGESLSLLPIMAELTQRGIAVLATSGTVTSAAALERRVPPGVIHQFSPLDTPGAVRRFLAHWRPDLVLMAESELWPNLLEELARHRVPVALVNARMSERSFARWRNAPRTAAAVLSLIDQCLAQSEADASRFRTLGARHVSVPGNLKFDVDAPPANPMAVAALSAHLAGRPVWFAASTHPGEEDMVVAAHRANRDRFPDLLTIVAPRHPERGEDVLVSCQEAGLRGALRSRGAEIGRDLDVYVADTIGELGLFFRACPLVFMGGSLVPSGGHNPIEPGKLGIAILHGPHVHNFAETYAALDGAGGAVRLDTASMLSGALEALIGDQATLRDMGSAAAHAVAQLGGATDRTIAAIAPYLAWIAPGPR